MYPFFFVSSIRCCRHYGLFFVLFFSLPFILSLPFSFIPSFLDFHSFFQSIFPSFLLHSILTFISLPSFGLFSCFLPPFLHSFFPSIFPHFIPSFHHSFLASFLISILLSFLHAFFLCFLHFFSILPPFSFLPSSPPSFLRRFELAHYIRNEWLNVCRTYMESSQ